MADPAQGLTPCHPPHPPPPQPTQVENAAIYLPTGEKRYNPQFTADGFELTVQTNHLGAGPHPLLLWA